MKILLAEDDKNLGRLLSALLKKEGIYVKWVDNGLAAYKECYADGYDVLVLDWMMDGMSGIDLCSTLRGENYQGKIMLLTARDSLDDKVLGLNAGADDYIVKPFEMAEVLARLHALVRRHGEYAPEILNCGGIILNSADYTLSFRDKNVQLRPREYKLMEILLRNAGKIVIRDVLLDRIWGIDNDITDNNLDVQIRSLRRKTDSIGIGSLIQTVRGVGYVADIKNL